MVQQGCLLLLLLYEFFIGSKCLYPHAFDGLESKTTVLFELVFDLPCMEPKEQVRVVDYFPHRAYHLQQVVLAARHLILVVLLLA